MDLEQETKNIKLGLIVVLIFFISAWMSCDEMKYTAGGKTAEATIDRVVEGFGRRGRPTRTVHYHYRPEGGEVRRASVVVSDDWRPPADGKLTVEYLGDTSRPAGQRNVGAMLFFFGSLLALMIGGFLFWRHVREATRTPIQSRSIRRR